MESLTLPACVNLAFDLHCSRTWGSLQGDSIVKSSETSSEVVHLCVLGFCWEYAHFLDVILQEANAKNFPHLSLRVIHTTPVFIEFSWMGMLPPEEYSCEEPENRSLHLVTALL
ncbi:uncharacterized protein LJ206_009502 [Theristicus caerulescens]